MMNRKNIRLFIVYSLFLKILLIETNRADLRPPCFQRF
jgi:hypothetical protein